MAPKKRNSKNGFMVFAMEWKGKYGKQMKMPEVTTEAGKIWEKMTPQQRGPYKERAKQENCMSQRTEEKLTCTGQLVSVIEKEKLDAENKIRQMKRQIERTVRNSVKNGELEEKRYHFIMVNYFTKFAPAEISVCEYSLKNGVGRVFHSYVNPGGLLYGQQYDAQTHANATHMLPLPPEAMGDASLEQIYNKILDFVRDEETNEVAPLYTHNESIPIVISVLQFLQTNDETIDMELEVYSIQYLLYILKDATCELGEVEKPQSHFITDAYFDRDVFEYEFGIACDYHDKLDKGKYCTSSYVIRWGYMFSEYMCRDIAICLMPGRHIPKSRKSHAVVALTPSSNSHNKLMAATASSSNSVGKARSLRKAYDDDSMSTGSGSTSEENRGAIPRTYRQESSSSRKYEPGLASLEWETGSAIGRLDDPRAWPALTRGIPEKPKMSDFDIDYTSKDRMSELDLTAAANRSYGQLPYKKSKGTTSHGPGRRYP